MKSIGVACILVLLGSGRVLPQVELGMAATVTPAEPYFVDAMSFAVGDGRQGRLDVYIQVSHNALSFVKRENAYYASFELTVAISNERNKLIGEKTWTEEVRSASFEESISPHLSKLAARVFEVPPGAYNITTSVRDNETRTVQRVAKRIAVPDYAAHRFALSDIMLVRRLTVADEKRTIIPNISPNLGDVTEPCHLFFETYNAESATAIRFSATVFDKAKARKLQVDTVKIIPPGRQQVFMRVDHTVLPIGDYSVYVQAFRDTSADDSALATTSRSFVIRWSGMPEGIKDLDLAVEQLVYIAQEKELSHIKQAPTPEEKQKRFMEFWKQRDPNPNTPRNEKMEEYYAKVEFANRNFKHYIDGWRTDMGMVYIIFGPPNNVDRHPFDSNSKPYEVWTYYELNHRFVFVDNSGFGDYRLTTPIWEVWQRPRN